MNGFFITGTDTGVGKTALSALLLAELCRRGINAAPMKPVQTGVRGQGSEIKGQKSECPDLDYSLSMAGMTVSDDDYKNMAPYRFEPACSPHLAAEMAGTEIEIARIVSAAQALVSEYECIVAEGAGGVLVPLNRRELMLDLMVALKFPVVLAARPGLGTINHTLLSVRALRSAGLDIAGVVFMESEKPTTNNLIEDDNAVTIEQFGGVSFLGKISYCPALREQTVDGSSLSVTVAGAIEKIVNKLGL